MHGLNQEMANFSVKDKKINISGVVGHIQFLHFSFKNLKTILNLQTIQKQISGPIWPMGVVGQYSGLNF